MAEYTEVEDTVQVPQNTGIKGFLHVIERILKRPRVQSINIDSRGNVVYKRYVREGEDKEPLAVSFESLAPYGVIRNGKVVELAKVDQNAAVALSQLFNLCSIDHLNPAALVSGANTTFWGWYERTTAVAATARDELYGIPFLTDRMVEDRVLILCAGYAKGGALIDTQKSYKIVIPELPPEVTK